MNKRVIFLLAALFAAMFMVQGQPTYTISGTGNNLTLHINGAGAMANYSFFSAAPWDGQRENIKTIVIGNSVTTIGEYAFSGCNNVTSVTIGDSVTSIGMNAFENCSLLPSITIPNRVIVIESSAFNNCSGLTSVVIPASVASIASTAFGACNSLIAFTVATSNVAYSDNNGVLFNKNQTTLLQCPAGKTGVYTIPTSVTTVVENAFFNCGHLTSINIPENVSVIETNAFTGCGMLTSFVVASTNLAYSDNNGVLFNKSQTILVRYPAGKAGNYTIPDSVATIDNYAFSSSILLLDITIPNTVTQIGEYAFLSCQGLTSVTIPASIGAWAFSLCNNLTSVTITASVDSIGNYAFAYSPMLTTITNARLIPQNIGDDLFMGYNFTTITLIVPVCALNAYRQKEVWSYFATITTNAALPCQWYIGSPNAADVVATFLGNTLEISGTGAMQDFPHYAQIFTPWARIGDSIHTAIIHEGVTSIGGFAFASTHKMKSITIPNSVITIGEWAFAGGDSLTSITIPDGVTSLGEYIFYFNVGLTSVNIGKSLASMGQYPFGHCYGLTTIEVSPDNMHYSSENSILFNKNKTTLVQCPAGRTGTYVIPATVTAIAYAAFFYCRHLTAITMPNSLTSIGNNVFANCEGLTAITIPPLVTSIESAAFGSCSQLKTVTNASITPQIIDSLDVFWAVDLDSVTLIVPICALEAYQNAAVWSDFATIIGDSSLCETAIADLPKADKITLYPNPAHDQLTIESDTYIIHGVQIVDLMGKTVLNAPLIHNTVNISNLPAGVYFAKITTDKGEATKKIIKN